MNARFNWSQTLARPTFLELAPTVTYDFVEDESLLGNAGLQLSSVENYDLRWEWFITPGEVLAMSWFKKEIERPIEREPVSSPTFGSFLYSRNYPYGEVQGMEFEVRKKLDFLPSLLQYLTLQANYTFINATVKMPDRLSRSLENYERVIDGETNTLTQTHRDMVGQPEFLLNINTTWECDRTGTTLGLFYNIRGDMLKSGAAPSVNDATPNVYYRKKSTVNLNFAQKVGPHWTVTFRMKNLLDPTIKQVYRLPNGNEFTKRSYKDGISYSLGVGCSW
jgi:outer membrane receptor protein involved in Fe transport